MVALALELKEEGDVAAATTTACYLTRPPAPPPPRHVPNYRSAMDIASAATPIEEDIAKELAAQENDVGSKLDLSRVQSVAAGPNMLSIKHLMRAGHDRIHGAPHSGGLHGV